MDELTSRCVHAAFFAAFARLRPGNDGDSIVSSRENEKCGESRPLVHPRSRRARDGRRKSTGGAAGAVDADRFRAHIFGVSRPAVRKALLRGAGVLLGVVALASCGSRTGLFVPDDDLLVDASPDVTAVPDGSPDVQLADDRDNVPDVIEEPVGCVPGTFDLSPATSQIMFVLDRSKSMTYRLDSNVEAPPAVMSRWTALRDALDQVITPFSSQIAMGARFYPQVNATGDAPGACRQDTASVAIAPALNNADRILAVFNDTQPIGGTPTAGALSLAAQQTSARRAVARAIVVATDGAPNCNSALDPNNCVCTAPSTPGGPCAASSPNDGANCLDDVQTVEVVRQIYENRKIPVFVVGIGVTGGFAPTLDAMALAGGRPRSTAPHYYPAETPAELSSAFTVVRDSVAKCSYVTPSAPNDPDLIDITIDQKPIARDPTHVDGWDWIDQEYGQLQLFGSACAAANAQNVDGTVVCERPDASIGSDR